MRIDRLLCCLRFARTRSAAQAMVEAGHIRRNGERILRGSTAVAAGDVLTLPLGVRVRLIEVLELPQRRGPPREAQAHYRELDPHAETALAARECNHPRGKPQP